MGTDTNLALFDRGHMVAALGEKTVPIPADRTDRSMLIFGVENLPEIVAELEKRGAVFIGPIADYPDWGIRCAYLRDPQGYLIELNSPLPRGEWSEDLRRDSELYDAATG